MDQYQNDKYLRFSIKDLIYLEALMSHDQSMQLKVKLMFFLNKLNNSS
jgi:hypothetical protein